MDKRADILNWNETARSDALSVPSAAAWLGGLGITPFAGLSLAAPFASDDLKAQLSFALIAYGAIILSFLGGIHWGLAIGAVPQTDNTLGRRIAYPAFARCLGGAVGAVHHWLPGPRCSIRRDAVGGYPGLAHARSPGLVSEA